MIYGQPKLWRSHNYHVDTRQRSTIPVSCSSGEAKARLSFEGCAGNGGTWSCDGAGWTASSGEVESKVWGSSCGVLTGLSDVLCPSLIAFESFRIFIRLGRLSDWFSGDWLCSCKFAWWDPSSFVWIDSDLDESVWDGVLDCLCDNEDWTPSGLEDLEFEGGETSGVVNSLSRISWFRWDLGLLL